LDNPTDNDLKSAAGIDPQANDAELNAHEDRRKFTRNALVGGAVLFSLGNRPAWSQVDQCISANTAASWAEGTHISHHPDANYNGYVPEKDASGNPTGRFCPPT
jgi:hypothetical protein